MTMPETINHNLPILIVATPLLTAIIIGLVVRKSNIAAWLMLTIGLTGAFAAAVTVLGRIIQTGEAIRYFMGSWPPPFGIELVIDQLSGAVLVLITGCALLTCIYSLPSTTRDFPDRGNLYYILFGLLISGLTGMVASGDVFNLYVLLEISALSSYALLACGRGLAYLATFKYIIIGTIGASFYLLGVGYIYIKTGTLNMSELADMLNNPELYDSISIKIGFILMIVGIWVKMAFFPLHGWLPNAYTYASTSTSCLIAPLMTKVSVYIMVRLMFYVFSADYIFNTLKFGQAVMIMACVAILYGSISALAQQNLKRMLCYIIVAEIGYMVGGVWMANKTGFTGAVYHILADGLMTLCLFMAVGAIIYKSHTTSLSAMENLFQKMPITGVIFLIGAFSVIGIPPTCGFFSKWYLIGGAIEAKQWFFIVSLLISSLINAIIFFRLIEIAFFPDLNQGEKQEYQKEQTIKMNEAPITMLVPMTIVAISLIVLGLYTKEVTTHLISWIIPAGI